MLGHLGLGHLRILEHSGCLADIGLGHAGLSSTFPPPGSGGSQTCHGPFPNQAVLEFSKGAEDVKDELSAGTDRIDVLGQRLEAYPPVFECRYDFHQVFQGTPQPTLPVHRLCATSAGNFPVPGGPSSCRKTFPGKSLRNQPSSGHPAGDRGSDPGSKLSRSRSA